MKANALKPLGRVLDGVEDRDGLGVGRPHHQIRAGLDVVQHGLRAASAVGQ
jgi:hypothetical protein